LDGVGNNDDGVGDEASLNGTEVQSTQEEKE